MLRKQFAFVLLNTIIGIAVTQAGAVSVSREEIAKARQYDPHIARFTSRDPVFGRFWWTDKFA